MSSVVGVKGNAGQTNYAAKSRCYRVYKICCTLELLVIFCNAAPGFIETEMTSKLNEDVVQGWRRYSFEKRWNYRRCC
jgi:3-oxoacyl-[acyl-carrier protein] reductase